MATISSTINPTRNHTNSIKDPNSPVSETMRQAAWITGSRRPPSTAAAFLSMARQRRDVSLAREAWNAHKKDAMESQDRPNGSDLIRWWKDERRQTQFSAATRVAGISIEDRAGTEHAEEHAVDSSDESSARHAEESARPQ